MAKVQKRLPFLKRSQYFTYFAWNTMKYCMFSYFFPTCQWIFNEFSMKCRRFHMFSIAFHWFWVIFAWPSLWAAPGAEDRDPWRPRCTAAADRRHVVRTAARPSIFHDVFKSFLKVFSKVFFEVFFEVFLLKRFVLRHFFSYLFVSLRIFYSKSHLSHVLHEVRALDGVFRQNHAPGRSSLQKSQDIF